ncbi:MAG: M48 family metallopeptidase [Acidobacteriota bacterium]
MRRITIPAFMATLLFASACSTNPVTGQRQFNIVSESQAAALGAQENANVIEEFGIYNEVPALTETVTRIGRKVAAASDRPNLPWSFAILDTPMINAMALPGGYVYVTRGILERMNSEDELAGVIAHEISHVSARHIEARLSQEQLAQFGLVLGSIVAGPAASQTYGGLVQLGTQLLFTKYSRQQESQADLLGTAYMTEAGYNPEGARNMLLALQRLDTGKDGSGVDRYFIDHPDPGKRIADVQSKIQTLEQSAPAVVQQPMDRNSFVRKLQGIIVGDSTMQTTIRDDVIYQRRYGMIVPIPRGWTTVVSPGALFALTPESSKDGSALIAQDIPLKKLQGAVSAQSGVRTLLQQMGLQFVNSSSASSRTGEKFPIDLWRGQTNSGVVAVETTQFTEADHAVVLMQITPASKYTSQGVLGGLLATVRFDRAQARAAEPPRMKTGTGGSAVTWSEIAVRSTGNPADAPQIAHINGFDTNSAVPQSMTLKLPEDVVAGEQ